MSLSKQEGEKQGRNKEIEKAQVGPDGTQTRGLFMKVRGLFLEIFIHRIYFEEYSQKTFCMGCLIARMLIARMTQWHIHRNYYTPLHWSKGKASAFFDIKKFDHKKAHANDLKMAHANLRFTY